MLIRLHTKRNLQAQLLDHGVAVQPGLCVLSKVSQFAAIYCPPHGSVGPLSRDRAEVEQRWRASIRLRPWVVCGAKHNLVITAFLFETM